MTKYIYYLLVAFTAIACSRYPVDVKQALKLAGDNRAELEKVLDYYSKRPEDSLKYKSACFLIASMPYHYTVHDAQLDTFRTFLDRNKLHGTIPEAYFDWTYIPVVENMEIRQDLYYITSDYLIRNIDFSFKIWQETPWSNYFSFDDFCEEILPYRLSHEPLENWKEEYYNVFHPVIDTMTHHNNPKEVGLKLLSYINEQAWTFYPYLSIQGLGASTILRNRFGNCKEQAEFVNYVMRSVGIPSGMDVVIQEVNSNNKMHLWNYLRNTDGNCVTFDYYETYETQIRRTQTRKYGKVYRKYHAPQDESLPVKYRNRYIPSGSMMRDVLLKDVSSEYFPDTHISIQSESPTLFNRKDLACLCVFNNREWIPIALSEQKNGTAVFRNIEPGILYQMRLIDETRNIAASNPFILRGNEDALFFDADTANLQLMTLLRKYRIPNITPVYVTRAINGKFQGANQPDFSDSITLHTIRKATDLRYVDIKLGNFGKFKYVRYLSADNGFNNMAEIQFYSDGQRLHGEVIGTDGEKDDFPNSSKQAAFDDDPLSFFDALEADGAWTGLKLDKAYRIDAIRYIFRNDDNNIRPGDTYELLYQGNMQWLSAGRQTADTTVLQYENVPSNTLYWLHNHTRGKEERPFTYENGNQIWW